MLLNFFKILNNFQINNDITMNEMNEIFSWVKLSWINPSKYYFEFDIAYWHKNIHIHTQKGFENSSIKPTKYEIKTYIKQITCWQNRGKDTVYLYDQLIFPYTNLFPNFEIYIYRTFSACWLHISRTETPRISLRLA